MSGGHWNHQNIEIEDLSYKCDYLKDILYKVYETSQIIDYAESCDTSKKDAKNDVYVLWKDFFNKKYNR